MTEGDARHHRPQWAGKTTLIAQLAGELAPDGGRIRFAGADVTGLPAQARSCGAGAIVPDHQHLPGLLRARQRGAGRPGARRPQLPVLAGAGEPATRARARRRWSRSVSARGPTCSRPTWPTASSGSSRSRCWPAGPRLLLLDEPMAGMGPEESRRRSSAPARPQGPATDPAGRARHGRGVRAGRPHHRARLRAGHRHRLARRDRRHPRGPRGVPGRGAG